MKDARSLPYLFLVIFLFSCTDKMLIYLRPADIVLAAIATFLLIKPQRLLEYFLVIGQICAVAWNFPSIANHEFLLSVYGIIWLFITKDYDRLLRGSQILMGLVYGISGLHKLNSGFYDPQLSCIQFFVPLFKDFSPWLAALVTATEIYLCLGFIFFNQEKIKWVFFPAIAFHFILSLLGFWDFSAIAMTLLAKSKSASRATWFLITLHILIYLGGQFFSYQKASILLSVTCSMALLTLIDFNNVSQNNFNLNPRLIMVLTFVFVWGLGPYWGGPHYPTFSMFSNLQLQSVSSNSFILEKPLLEINQNWWKVLTHNRPVGLPYFGNFLLRDNKDTIYFHENHLYEKERSGSMLLENRKSKKIKTWPEDFPLSKSPSYISQISLPRRIISGGRCQW